MNIVIVGYDRVTEFLTIKHPVPPSAVDTVRAIAGVGSNDPNLALAYELDPAQVQQIAAAAGLTLDPTEFWWFLEAARDGG